MVRVGVLALLLVSVASFAQDMRGRWEGELKEEGTVHHLILDVERKADGAWAADFYSIDETSQPFPVDTMTADASAVKFTLLGLGASYSGTLQAGGSTIVGTWTQQGALPLLLRRTGPVPLTPLDLDHAFDNGSRIGPLAHLAPQQVDNLVLLARVWGFLKYHHPTITSGQRHWDYELLRVLPAVLEARDRGAGQQVLSRWIGALGPLPACHPCSQLNNDHEPALAPDLGWIHDRTALGERLSGQLAAIYAARPVSTQFYFGQVAGVGNPVFRHEPSYDKISFPDPGFQLLGLFRVWNALQYWYPYRTVSGQDWPAVLRAAIPKFALASDKEAYGRALLLFVATINDTHSNLWGSLGLRPPTGLCRIPVNFRFVEGMFVVTGSSSSKVPLGRDLQAGDVLEQIGGTPVADLVRSWSPFYADSNEAARSFDLALNLGNGECGAVQLQMRRRGEVREASVTRVPTKDLDRLAETHDLPGPAFQLLSPDVAYLKLSSVKAAEVAHQLEVAASTKGLIVDIRNYPAEFVPFALGSHLVTSPVPFVTFTMPDPGNPGAFTWGVVVPLSPAEPHYGGKVVVLVDESSLSQAEYTAMALRASPRATIVGSTTAGADGNVSRIPLPGGFRTAISGIGIFYPDRRPTQRVGIVPDIKVQPTVAGIAAGRDEALERAVREIVGPGVSEDRVRELSRPAVVTQ